MRGILCTILLILTSCSKIDSNEPFIQEGNTSVITSGNQLIYPIPQEMSLGEGHFSITEKTIVLVPGGVSNNDLFLARYAINEVSDKYGLTLQLKETSEISSYDSFILIGAHDNPLIKQFCKSENIEITKDNPGKEGYILNIEENQLIIAGSDEQGTFYGFQSFRQLLNNNKNPEIPCLRVRDWPSMPFRGIKLYIPGKENISFYKRFVQDFMALYKYNKVIIEVNAVMRLDRHPELNSGWREFADYLNYSRLNFPLGEHGRFLNSSHHDAGDGEILEKEEVRDIVEFSTRHFLEVIPELPTLDHSFYLLTKHRELAEVPTDRWPSAYCPSKTESYDLLFDVFDEYIEVMQPKMIHVGKDEWWGTPIGACPLCKEKDYLELFEQDLNKIHQYLSSKNIKMAMWGDHLLENVRGVGSVEKTSTTGYKYEIPGGLPLSVVEEKIPKDILIFNWFFRNKENDSTLSNLGFNQIYGNFLPSIENWESRKTLKGVKGGAPSSWGATTEFNFGKDLMGYFIGCSNLLWSENGLTPNEHFEIVQEIIPGIRENLDGKKLPSENCEVVPFSIKHYFNSLPSSMDLSTLISGSLSSRNKVFNLENVADNKAGVTASVIGNNNTPTVQQSSSAIKVNQDASSILFLHACENKANNDKSYYNIYNFDDSADLLGWYEIIYEDGFVSTIPIRYGVNILEWNVKNKENFNDWKRHELFQSGTQDKYCYSADAIDCSTDMAGNPITFFAYEWENERYGKVIKEIRIKGSYNFVNAKSSKKINNNAITLIALSLVEKQSN